MVQDNGLCQFNNSFQMFLTKSEQTFHYLYVGLRVERRHHLQSVCLQDVVLVDQTDENSLDLSLVGQCYRIQLTAQT
ncbi:hypothetical protein AVEN_163476-1 [Araneus ventricosus]|uniref:Uncharacterized protein n=1 Tax=Araneus ventricosus TaxID=182803 RepID=A0A4Y2BPJ1_ARAVE|nr:hypothetical protein AVEN_163476-1 [Araneus ventricosus]